MATKDKLPSFADIWAGKRIKVAKAPKVKRQPAKGQRASNKRGRK